MTKHLTDTPQQRGMARLWYASENMLQHAPKPFYLYVANRLNGTAWMNVVHNSLYARAYARYAERAGINYTVLYTDFAGMRPADAGARRLPGEGGVVWNYRSSWDFLGSPGVADTPRASTEEQLLLHCHAFGLQCGLTPACKAAIAADCGAVAPAGCAGCIRAHAGSLMQHGCPPAGFARCEAYCVTPRRSAPRSGRPPPGPSRAAG